MTTFSPWTSPNGQTWTIHPDAVPMVEPFFKRLNELHPQYESLGGYANRPMRTLDGRNLGGLSTHASGYTLDVKAPDAVLRQMAAEFPNVRWGGNFKSHYDPVHFEFGAPSQGQQPAPQPQSAPTQVQPQGSPPMAEPQPSGGFLENLSRGFANPLTQGGLGLMLASAQGGNMAQGLFGGVQSGLSAQQAMEAQLRRQQQQMMLKRMASDPNFAKAAGVPPELMQLAVAGEDPGMVAKFIASKPDRDLQRQQLELGNQQLQENIASRREMTPIQRMQAEAQARLSQAQIEQMRNQSPDARKQIAIQSGIDPNSEQGRQFILNGQYAQQTPEQALMANMLKRMQEQQKPQATPQPRVIPQSFEGGQGADAQLIQTQVGGQPAPSKSQEVIDVPGLGPMPRSDAETMQFLTAKDRGSVIGEAIKKTDLGKGAREEIDKKESAALDGLQRIRQVRSSMDPSFLEYGTQAKMALSSVMAKAGKLPPKDQEQLYKFATFRRDAAHNINQAIKDNSGATVTEQELRRNMVELPNAGSGMFDGDDAVTFQAKVDRAEETLALGIARMRHLRDKGFTGPLDAAAKQLPIETMRSMINSRAKQIEAQIKQQNPQMPGPIVDREVDMRVKKEFGI